jgi:hypothetical protein
MDSFPIGSVQSWLTPSAQISGVDNIQRHEAPPS